MASAALARLRAGVEATLPTASLRLHPATDRVPEPSGEDWRLLLASVRSRGIRVPVEVTAAGLVLDGRLRLRAAEQLGLPTVPVRLVEAEDATAYVLRAALERRHLTQGQKAALAAYLYEHEQANADGRRRSNANLRRGDRAPERAALPPRGRVRDRVAAAAGVSPRSLQDARTLKAADPSLFERVVAGELSLGKALRRHRQAQRRAALEHNPRLPPGEFEVILADPPWQLGGDPESSRAVENHYPTLPLEEIKSLEVPAAPAATLFLWAPAGLLPQALEVMDAWGFQYKTQIVWVKPSIGLGQIVRNRHELLLIGTRGRFHAPDPADRPASVVEEPRGRHSQKPARVYELIERMYPGATKLELFARTARAGWASYGNEVAT
jgi:N6-adenosine-specific RNA methylase IME4